MKLPARSSNEATRGPYPRVLCLNVSCIVTPLFGSLEGYEAAAEVRLNAALRARTLANLLQWASHCQPLLNTIPPPLTSINVYNTPYTHIGLLLLLPCLRIGWPLVSSGNILFLILAPSAQRSPPQLM